MFSICEMEYLTKQVYTYCKCCPTYMHDQIFKYVDQIYQP